MWLKMIYPLLSGLVEKIPPKAGKLVCNCLIVFMIFNMILSSLALARYTERNTVLSADGMQTAIQDTAADGEVPAEMPKETPAGNGMPDETAPGTEAPDAVPGGGISAASDNARAVTPLEAFLGSHYFRCLSAAVSLIFRYISGRLSRKSPQLKRISSIASRSNV